MTTWHLGQTSQRYESGKNGAGTISTGHGDHGGVSYGTYQLSSNLHRVQEFIASSPYKDDFAGLQVNSDAFKAKWKSLAAHDPQFGVEQHRFIERTHYQPQVSHLKAAGLDLSKHGPAVQDMVWSTSVQFGPQTKLITTALHSSFGQHVDVNKLSDADIVTSVQNYKIAHNEQLFHKSSANVCESTLNRAKHELAALMKLTGQHVEVSKEVAHNKSEVKHATEGIQSPININNSVSLGIAQLAQQAAELVKKTAEQHVDQSSITPKSHANNGVFDKGDRGDDVKHVQTMLASLGAKVGVDGIYGHETERAVKGYQMMNGLEADGIVGPKTMAALKEDAQRVPTQSAAAPVQVEPKYQGSPDKYVPQQTQAANAAQPELSNTAQGLIVDAKTHIQNWIAANGLQWNEQFHQAAHSIASAAHQQGFPSINMFAVNGGQIDFGHKEGFILKTGSIETAVASNTDISKSLQAMADVDQNFAVRRRSNKRNRRSVSFGGL